MKHYGLLGHPLGHTMSPPIHERLSQLEGIEADYTLFDIAPEDLPRRMDELLRLDGFNVTIPYKGAVMEYMDALDDTALRYSSVNCVSIKDGRAVGYNTDCTGFLRSLEAAGGRLDGRVLMCGCGGVGRMIAVEALLHGADLTVSVKRGRESTVDEVRKIMQGRGMDCDIHITYPDEIDGSFDTLVNATGAGMYPDVDGCPVSEDVIARAGFVYDVIYNPEETRLMSIARRHGIPAAGGMGMLVYQAAAAHEYWTGAEYDEADIDRLIADMHRMMI